MGENVLIIKGDIVYSIDKDTIKTVENGYLIAVDGIVIDVFKELPEDYEYNIYIDYTGHLVLPGMTDLHLHAPQAEFIGLGMDSELLDWLKDRVFPTEAKYGDEKYATMAYEYFRERLRKSETTRACVFSSIHGNTTDILMEMLDETGIKAYVGKVSMDRNGGGDYGEAGADEAVSAAGKWIEATKDKYENVKPIVTPRFVPACSEKLLKGLGELADKYGLPVQSHLSESLKEIELVKKLEPWADYYGQVYEKYGLFGGSIPTVMAHCVHSTEGEIQALAERNVFVAHCPSSNANLGNGVAPIKSYLNKGIKVGLGTDVAAGHSMSILRAMADSIQFSKLRNSMCEEGMEPIKLSEAFYMGTMGGGAFFGKVGSFLPGYECDVVVINDKNALAGGRLSLHERLERAVYMNDECELEAKYVSGEQVL